MQFVVSRCRPVVVSCGIVVEVKETGGENWVTHFVGPGGGQGQGEGIGPAEGYQHSGPTALKNCYGKTLVVLVCRHSWVVVVVAYTVVVVVVRMVVVVEKVVVVVVVAVVE